MARTKKYSASHPAKDNAIPYTDHLRKVHEFATAERSVRSGGVTETLTNADIMLRKQFEAGIAGKSFAQRDYLHQTQLAATVRQEYVRERCEYWSGVKASNQRRIDQARAAKLSSPRVRPHPDDIIIDWEDGVRIPGPMDDGEWKKFDETVRVRDALFLQQAMENAINGVRLRDRPTLGAPGLLGYLLNGLLPPSLRMSDVEWMDRVDRLSRLSGDEVDMIFTDPPYNVEVDGHVSGLGKVKHREFAFASGEMSPTEFTAFLRNAMAPAAARCRAGAIAYVCMDWRHMREMLAAGDTVFHELKNLCVWNKTNGGMGSFYRSKHELVFVWKVRPGQHVNSFGLGDTGRYRTNVWDYAGVNTFSASRNEDCPPFECAETALPPREGSDAARLPRADHSSPSAGQPARGAPKALLSVCRGPRSVARLAERREWEGAACFCPPLSSASIPLVVGAR